MKKIALTVPEPKPVIEPFIRNGIHWFKTHKADAE